MTIDLTKVKVRPSLLDEEKEADVHEIVADLIWKSCVKDDIKKADFALKLLHSNGEIEVTNTELGYILETTSAMKYWLAKGIEDSITKARSNIENNS